MQDNRNSTQTNEKLKIDVDKKRYKDIDDTSIDRNNLKNLGRILLLIEPKEGLREPRPRYCNSRLYTTREERKRLVKCVDSGARVPGSFLVLSLMNL